MDKRTFLRNALNKREAGIGMWLTMPGTALARTVAQVPGFNWFLVDAEHGQITDKDYFELTASLPFDLPCGPPALPPHLPLVLITSFVPNIRGEPAGKLNNAITSHGISPIIRIPYAEGWLIKRALDSGAHGIMVPMVHTAEIAKSVVSLSKYAPQGTRGCGSPFTHYIFGVEESEYENNCNDNLLTILQIESQQGLENIEEIAAVPGVDIIFVGPFDLAKSMDVQFGGDAHQAAIAKILKATKAAGKFASIFCMTGEQGRQRLNEGFDMVSIAMDTDSLMREFGRQMAAVKGQ